MADSPHRVLRQQDNFIEHSAARRIDAHQAAQVITRQDARARAVPRPIARQAVAKAALPRTLELELGA
jgi:hypothetical protein